MWPVPQVREGPDLSDHRSKLIRFPFKSFDRCLGRRISFELDQWVSPALTSDPGTV